MATPIDPQEYAAARRKISRKERREEFRTIMQEDIVRSQCGNGVQVIPPVKRQYGTETLKKLRAAAYVRVSTQEEQQVGSFDMQILHFRQKIENDPELELVEIYQDEGVSGTTTLKRMGFQRMMNDAKDGKIDLILTKSINRFGRNIVDILDNLRILTNLEPPIPVTFETEGITYSGDGRNNFLIAILSALAEMESQQKSEAIKAGIRWRMEEGIYKFSVYNTLGYYRDHFGRIVIEPTEAEVVKYIYESCIEGASPQEIADALTQQGFQTPMGKDRWRDSTIRGILRNEKYCGDALMQKTYTKDFRTHRSVKNTELNMFFKEDHHVAIVDRKVWQKVQSILSVRHEVRQIISPLRQLTNHFVVSRVKNGLFKGFYILDKRWSAHERRQFGIVIDTLLNPHNTKGE